MPAVSPSDVATEASVPNVDISTDIQGHSDDCKTAAVPAVENVTIVIPCDKLDHVRVLCNGFAVLNDTDGFAQVVRSRGISKEFLDKLCFDYCNRDSYAQHVELLISLNVNVNYSNAAGMTNLMNAARYGSCAIVRLLLDAGADIDMKDSAGRTAMVHACASVRQIFDGHANNARRALAEDKIRATLAAEHAIALAAMRALVEAEVRATLAAEHAIALAAMRELVEAEVRDEMSTAHKETQDDIRVDYKKVDNNLPDKNDSGSLVVEHKMTPDGDQILVTSQSNSKIFFQKQGTSVFVAL